MNEENATVSSDPRLIRYGIYAEIVGIILLSVILFVHVPPVLIVCMPLGIGLLGLGWLAWAWVFFKNL